MPYKNNFLQGKLEFARGGSWSSLKAMMLATGASITELKKQMYVPPTHHVQVKNVLIYALQEFCQNKLVFKFTWAEWQTLLDLLKEIFMRTHFFLNSMFLYL